MLGRAPWLKLESGTQVVTIFTAHDQTVRYRTPAIPKYADHSPGPRICIRLWTIMDSSRVLETLVVTQLLIEDVLKHSRESSACARSVCHHPRRDC